MKQLTTRKYLQVVGLFFLSILVSEVFFHLRESRQDPQLLADRFNEQFVELDRKVVSELNNFSTTFRNANAGEGLYFDPGKVEPLAEKFHKQGLSYFVYRNNELIFWSSNAVPMPQFLALNQSSGLLGLGNGWYFFRASHYDGYYFVVLLTLKTNFQYQNDFLINRFHPDLKQAEDIFFMSGRSSEGFHIVDSKGEFSFSLIQRNQAILKMSRTGFLIISFIAAAFGLLLFWIFSYRFFLQRFIQRPSFRIIFSFGAVFFAVRVLLQVFSIPSVFYENQLFSASLFATSVVLPSLGDLGLHLIFLGIWIFFVYKNVRNQAASTFFKGRSLLIPVGAILLIFILIYLSSSLFQSLIIDSRLSLDVSFILNFDWFSTIGFIIIGGILFVCLFGSLILLQIIYLSFAQKRQYQIFLLLSFAVAAGIGFIFAEFRFLIWMFFFSVVLVHHVSRILENDRFNFSPIIIALFLFSAIGTFALHDFNGLKERELRKSLALQLATDQDLMAEYLFNELEESLGSDRQLANLIAMDPHNHQAIEQYLQHHYFYDFWGNYNLHAMVCLPEEILLIRPQNVEVPCQAYFDQYIGAFGRPTISDNLVYLESVPGRNNYIAMLRIPVTIIGGFSFYYLLILEFNSKHIIRDLGLPELLIDHRIDVNRELVNYSYATYYDGELVNKYGPFGYSINLASYGSFYNQFESFYFDDYDHIVYRKDEMTKIIVSKPSTSFLEAIAPFSILFLLFFILLIGYFLFTAWDEIFMWFRLTFKRRVQVFMIVLVILSAVTIGGVSTLFMANIYSEKTLSDIDEKTTSILINLEQHLANQTDLLHTDTYLISDLLLNLYNVLFSDINLFDAEGRLVASSRPRIFEEQIVGPRMDPIALAYFRQGQKSQLVHNEQIGEMNFLSSYVPLRNYRHDLIGYINLPYFDRQEEIRREVSYFILAFVNINLLLLFFAILLALTVSKYITRPLELIRSGISNLQLGRVNQKITWESDDEIGQMVKEYNRMINELEISADLLAKSERELAWREMAKQVAHEIKNPLTPMKLSIQHLHKAWYEQVPDWNERLERFSKTMIEQIDNLALIAGEFSDFAKMPSGINGPINLRDFIPEVLGIYSGIDKVHIEKVFPETDIPLYVLADRNQLLRVFNNLLRNSFQAYERDETAVIQVICEQKYGQILCHVRDYGCGIPEALKPKIFSPNFTTKTGGMGLGLSMVKAIVENLGGTISFQSSEGVGTTITLALPGYSPGEDKTIN